jgi:mannose-6-phosphate isomerase-like protein (cupin superfamily)
MQEKIDLAQSLSRVSDHWSPRIVGRLNDYKIQVVKVKGEFVWHTHPETDEFFLVIDGQLTIKLRERTVDLGPGQLFVVPRGVKHCPAAVGECELLLIEPIGTPNTGDVGGERTAPEREL